MRRPRAAAVTAAPFFAALALSTLLPRDARACGVSGVGGQAGVACSLDQPEAQRVTAAYTFTSTALSFSGERRADVERHAVAASLAIPFRKTWVFEGSIGVLPIGSLALNHVNYTFNPSFLAALSATYRLLPEKGALPFIFLTGTLAGLVGSTRAQDASTQDFDALDLRIGAVVGKHVTPHGSAYLAGRAFGGPVSWRVEGSTVNGTDVYHYQVGLGAAYAFGPAHVFVEGIPLGERAITAGFGAAL
jgi:hypothetical protein